ncbi:MULTISPECIES: 4Fe-4S binding protein [unclassified Adlercreutzia]|uniref:4Fe-4S dicluster domain-containing protein n=1 Tax=unclassified Adlercreutzia TaxID=2636013 RepID=UPI0013EBFC8C|nr:MULTISPECIES: 4Fe-4S binding protein [unclassified Adlercreutzia]
MSENKFEDKAVVQPEERLNDTAQPADADGPAGASGSDSASPAGSAEPVGSGHPKTFTRRNVLAMAGCGVAGLVVGGVLASWGVTERSIASGRIDIRTTPTKMIVTDRARCSGCQRCEMMCTLKNDGRVSQHIARVRVWDNYNYGAGADTGEGSLGSGKGACQFTVEHCKQCEDPACANYCPVHAIYADPEYGARIVDGEACVGCGMCAQACPWNMPRVDTETGISTKCISCGRCAEQCPNGAIQFIDWQDIAQKIIDQGVVRTVTLVEA